MRRASSNLNMKSRNIKHSRTVGIVGSRGCCDVTPARDLYVHNLCCFEIWPDKDLNLGTSHTAA